MNKDEQHQLCYLSIAGFVLLIGALLVIYGGLDALQRLALR